jgi:hypothetical protein
MVRGESVNIIATHTDDQKVRGVLGATVDGANVLVEYPDGEQGYVREDQIDRR